MSKHTPGPWQIGYSGRIFGSKSVHTNGILYNSGISSRSFSETVCEVYGDVSGQEGGAEAPKANAALIAAAPELLEMCQKALRYVNASHPIKQQLEQVIAKAEGR